MRITALAKEKTRDRILVAARRLFAEKGFAQTTTRDLAASSGIAAGTLFNYFPNKEALAMTILAQALERGVEGFAARRRGAESLAEDLFAHVAAGLRELEPYRAFVGEVIESAMSPFTRSSLTAEGDRVRIRHLEVVTDILRAHRVEASVTFISMHLYWTLYLGVLAHWSNDPTPGAEETLAILDESLRLFVSSISSSSPSAPPHAGAHPCDGTLSPRKE